MNIKYLIGDATYPESDGYKIIAHCCNNIGAWGAGFVLAISKRWDKPEIDYLNLDNYLLGYAQYVEVETDITVVNIIGQEGISFKNGNPPIRYNAIEKGFENIANFVKDSSTSIHMPRIGCGLAGGNWLIMEKIIEKCFIKKNIPVFIYDLK